MRTGRHQFNYLPYVTTWAMNIMAQVKGYTLDKAYLIDRAFGVLVERNVNMYKEQLENVKRFSIMCGVYQEMKNSFRDFYKNLKRQLDILDENPYDYEVDVMAMEMKAVKDPNRLRILNKLLNSPGALKAVDQNIVYAKTVCGLAYEAFDLLGTKLNGLPRGLQNIGSQYKILAGEYAISLTNDLELRHKYWSEKFFNVRSPEEEEKATAQYDRYVARFNKDQEDYEWGLNLCYNRLISAARKYGIDDD